MFAPGNHIRNAGKSKKAKTNKQNKTKTKTNKTKMAKSVVLVRNEMEKQIFLSKEKSAKKLAYHGSGKVRRHRRVLRDNLEGISKASIRRLARRGGVQRISGAMYPEVRGLLRSFLQKIIRTAVVYTDHARRKTVSVYDVIHALKHEGRTLYGFEERTHTRRVLRVTKPAMIQSIPPSIQVQENTEADLVVESPTVVIVPPYSTQRNENDASSSSSQKGESSTFKQDDLDVERPPPPPNETQLDTTSQPKVQNPPRARIYARKSVR